MPEKTPKILIVSRGVWIDKSGTSSTLANLFENWGPESLAHIYIETKCPETKVCNNFFRISEFGLIRRLFNKQIRASGEVHPDAYSPDERLNPNAIREDRVMQFVRQNRSWFFSFAREILWLFNGWKSTELVKFIHTFNPDVIFLDGSPLILMNRLHHFVIEKTQKPAVIFLMDDVYTYKSCGYNPMEYLYKFFLRLSVKRVVDQCRKVFMASPKMKREYDPVFRVNGQFLTKGIDFTRIRFNGKEMNDPIRIVYPGQIIYGRDASLMAFVEVLKRINENGIKAQLYIHTSNHISRKNRKRLIAEGSSLILPAVPYDQLKVVMEEADILLFVESIKMKYRNLARLSFSTKLTDYFSAGKCIFAIGDKQAAPLEYLKEQDAAVIASSESEIKNEITRLIGNPLLISEYSRKSFECGRRNHDLKDVHHMLYNAIRELAVTD